ncbi:MAG: PKD domain-containing protein [Acidobacteria bacterium]|nr:PKD domain-containing protein [Acidobacteriota bacterium]
MQNLLRRSLQISLWFLFLVCFAVPVGAQQPTLGQSTLTPSTVSTGTPTQVLATVVITDTRVLATGVNLLRTDAAGRTLGTVGVMKDDGQNGDAAAGDQIFTLRVSINEAAQGTLYYRVSAAFRGVLLRVLSPVMPLTIAPPVSVPPSITTSLSPEPNANGWNNTPVTAHFVCTPGSAPIASCPSDIVVSAEGAGQTVSGTVTDTTGASASVTSTPFSIDRTAPSITGAVSPAGAGQWKVSFTCTDALSGIASCPSPQTVSAGPVHGEATDRAGNTAAADVDIPVDRVPPTIQLTATPGPNGNGWNNTPVTVTFACADDVGVATCPGPQTVDADGTQTVSGTAVDLAGNVAAGSIVLKIDRTAPSVQVSSPADGAIVREAALAISGSASDPLSGLTTVVCNGVPATLSGAAFSCTVNLSLGQNGIAIVASDAAGNTVTRSLTITLGGNAAPTAAPGGPYAGEAGTPIAFSGAASNDPDGDVLTYAWNFGDGQVGSGVQASHTYQTAGTFTVTLTVTDAGKLTSSASTLATVVLPNRVPTATAGGPYTGDVGTALVLAGGGTDPDGDTLTYRWQFNDGQIATGINPRRTFLSAGTFSVTLVVTDGRGGSAESNASITIRPANGTPVAKAGGPYTGQVGTAVIFDATPSSDPDNDPLTYAWDFGDGSQGSGANPSHAYLSPGSFTAVVTVADGRGRSASASAVVTIAALNRTPTARPGGPYAARVGEPIAFDATASTDPDGDALTFVWAFGDGRSRTGATTSYAYDAAGTYVATVTATDARGAAESATVTVTVTERQAQTNRPPVARVGGPYGGEAGLPIAFDASTSSDPDGDALTFTWAFSDGGTATGKQVTHVFATAQPHSATVTVTDAFQATAQATADVTVAARIDRAPPLVTLNAPKSALPGTDVVVSATATDNVGVVKVRLEAQGFAPSELSAAPYQRTIRIGDVAAPGDTIALKAIATDAAGNAGEATLVLTIASRPDTTGPTLTLEAPAEAAPGTDVRVLARATDDGGVADVAFSADGVAIATDVLAPFEATHKIPENAAAGSQIVIAADARDFAGNRTRQERSIAVTAAADRTPPVLTLNVPEQARPGTTIAVSATATDASGIAAVAFLGDDAPIGTISDAPYSLQYTVPAGLPAGTRIRFEARATDFAGQEAQVQRELLVVGADAAAALIVGEVFDDTTGLPLSGAIASIVGTPGVTAQTDARGRFVLPASVGVVRIRVTRAGFTEALRTVSAQSGQVSAMFDARLTPLSTTSTTLTPVLGGRAGGDQATLDVPAGALQASTAIALTRTGAHALEALTPLGWTPIAAVGVTPRDASFLQPASLDVPVPAGLAAGTPLVLGRFDSSANEWRAVSLQQVAPAQTRMAAPIAAGGQYAWLRADTVPTAPPVPQVGAAIAGISGVAIPDGTLAAVTPQPAVLFYQPGVRSDVHSAVTPGAAMPSGTPLQTRISERYEFQDGTAVQPLPMVQDLAFFRSENALVGNYPVTPSLTFEATTLKSGTISVEVLTPSNAVAAAVVGPSGARLELPSGEAVDLQAEADGSTRSAQIDRLEAATVGVELPAGLEFVGGVSLTLDGAALTAPGALSVARPGTLPNNAQVLLLQVVEVGGQTEFVLAGLGSLTADRVISRLTLPKNGLPFSGLRETGRYIFARATTPIGFVAGRILGAADAPIAGARVSVNDFAVISLSTISGYIAAAKVGGVTVTAADLARADRGTAPTAIAAAGDEVALDVRIVAQPPQITSTQPPAGGRNVPLSNPITLVFSKPIDPATLTGANAGRVTIKAGSTVISGAVSLSAANTVATFWPVSPLESNKEYVVDVAAGITDVAGRPLQGTRTFSFTTLNVLPPPPPPAGAITASLPDPTGLTTIRGTQGTVGLHDVVTIENLTTGAITPVLVSPNGGFEVRVAAALRDKLRLHIVGESGAETIFSLPVFSQTNADGSVTAAIGPEGGRVDGPNGTFADVKTGTFPDGALVTVRSVAEAAFPIQLDAEQKKEFGYVGGVQVDFNGAVPTQYVNVGIAAQPGDTVDNQWIVAQVVNIGGQQALNVVDTAKLISGAVRTSSPPCPGVTAAGVYGFYRAAHTVGLNYAQMYANQYGGLRVNVVIPFMTPAFAFPFAAFSYDVPAPVCFPVLTGRVTVVPNTQHVRIKQGVLAPADRELVVKNALAGTETRFPRNLLEMKFIVTGAKSDSFTVLLEANDGSRTEAAGVSVVPGAAGKVTIGVDADSITTAIKTVIIRNVTRSLESQFGATQMAITLPVTGGADDFYFVSALDATGAARVLNPADFTIESPNGVQNLAAKAREGTIDPTHDEIVIYNAAHPEAPLPLARARTKVELIDEDPQHGWTVEIPANQIVNGGFSFPFEGLLDDRYAIRVSYEAAPEDYQRIPQFRIVVSNPTTGQVIKTITTQAPPKDEPLNLGTITDDAQAPLLTSSPSRLDNFDPASPLTFTFSEPMSPDSIKAAALVEKITSAGGQIQRVKVQGEWRVYNNGRTATFIPTTSLEIGAEYSVTFPGADALNTSGLTVTDAAGNAMNTTRLAIKTFTPRLVAAMSTGRDGRLLEPIRQVTFTRKTIGNALHTFLFATTESRNSYKLLSIDATDVEHPAEQNSSFGGQGKKRLILVPSIGTNGNAAIRYRVPIDPPSNGDPACATGTQFVGDMAITTSSINEYSYFSFFNVTDPTSPCVIGNKLLNATPDFLNDYTTPGTVHQMGFAEGVTYVRHNNGVAAYAAVRELGIMSADIGKNLPEPFPKDRIKEGIYPGDYWDVINVNDRLLAVEKSARRIDVLDPNLSWLGSVDLGDEPRRLLFAKGYGSDDNEDGLITPEEQRDLVFVAGVGSITIVDATNLTSPVVIGRIAMKGVVRDLDIDPAKRRLFAGGSWSQQGGGDGFFIIDITKPLATSVDADADGWDDRVIYKRQYPQTINGFRVDAERGVAYIPTYPDGSALAQAGPGRLDILALYDNCCDLGVDFTTRSNTDRPRGDRTSLLAKEKEALQKGIAQGFSTAAASCAVPAGITMIEQGSGACLWRGDCGSNYQPGLSDHDFEVFIPQASYAAASACVVKALNEVFIDPQTSEPKPITVSDGSTIAFEDITFFPVVKELFETAKFDVMPPNSGGSDAVGDMGLGRRSLLLKWLLEGAYVSGVPGQSLEGRSLDAILKDLKTVTRIPYLEGQEWSLLQEYNLAKSKAFVRVGGASDPSSSFNGLFVKQMHDAGKAGIRAAMARMVANPAANTLLMNVTREAYNSNACISVVSTTINPNNWKEKPCTSFEEYVASAAARTLRGSTPLPLFSRDEIVNQVSRFYKVKADLERIVSDAQADAFAALVAQFIDRAKAETLPIYQQTLPNDPDAGQRGANRAQAVNKTAGALASAKLTLSPHVYNRGFRSGSNVRIAMYKSDAPGTGSLVKEIRQDIPGGDDRSITWQHNADGTLALSNGQAVPLFKLEVDQTGGFGTPHGVSFVVDLPDHSVQEANRQNNVGGFFYWVVDRQHPQPVNAPAAPYVPLPGDSLLNPDASCSAGPALTMTQTLQIDGQPLIGEANVGFGETVTITLTAQNLSAEPMQDVVVCSNVTNQCYSVGLLGAGQSKSITVNYTAPTTGVIVDGPATVYSPQSGVIEGTSTRLVVGCENYAIVPLPYNPEKSEVQMGGSAYRYYRVVNKRTGAPIVNATVTADVSGTFTGGVSKKTFSFTTGPQGEIKTGSETGLRLTPDENWLTLVSGFDYYVTITAVNGVAQTCSIPQQFTLSVKPREYSLSYARGTEIKGSAGLIFSTEMSAEAGMEIEKEMNSTTGATALSISQSFQKSGKLGVEFSLFKLKGGLGVGSINAGATIGTTDKKYDGKGMKLSFPFPLDADKSCAIANLTLSGMFQVNPLFTKLIELARSRPCADPSQYLVSTSSEFGREANESASAKFNFGRPAPGFGEGDKEIGVKFGVSGSNGFGIGTKYGVGYTFKDGVLKETSSSESYSLKGSIDFSAGLSLLPQDPPEEDGEKDEAGEVETEFFNKALEVQGSYSGTTSYGVGFQFDLTKLRPDLKPNSISISYTGPKRWGWKRNLLGAEENLGDGNTGSYSYSIDDPDLVDKAIANLANLDTIYKASARQNMADQRLDLQPTILNQELGKFGQIFYDTPISYSVSKEKGKGLTIPFGLEGEALGIKLGAGIEFKSESKVGWTKEKGVRFRGKDIKLESYGDTPPAQPDLGLWSTVQDTWKALLDSFAPTFSDVNRRFDNTVHDLITIQSLFTATLTVNPALLPEPVDVRLLTWRYTPTAVPDKDYRYMPSDSSGRGDAPHYGIGGFHQFSPEGFNLGGPQTLVIDYKDPDVVGLDESTFRIYAWNNQTLDWDYIGGAVDPVANTVTTTIDTLRLYTIAPSMPARTVTLAASGGEQVGTDDQAKRRFTIHASGLSTNMGQAVPDGTLYTVRSAPGEGSPLTDYGTILTADADPSMPGVQVAVTNGALQFEVEYNSPNGAYVPGRAIVYSTIGTAYGEQLLVAPQAGGQQ